MLHGCSLVLLLCATMEMALPCSGLTAEPPVNISVAGNVVPSVDAEQGVTVDRGSSERTQVTGVDKALQISDTKEPTKATVEQPKATVEQPKATVEQPKATVEQPKATVEQPKATVEQPKATVEQTKATVEQTNPGDEQTNPGDPTREKTPDFIPENVENETHHANTVKDTAINPVEGNIINDDAVSSPRNVVLLLIAKSGQDADNFWEDFQVSHAFSVDGYLQSCHNTDIDAARFSLDDALVSGSKGKECDCDRFLRSNVAALLFWARDVKGMATGTLSNANFTIPSSPGHEEPVPITRELDEADENNARSESHRDWRVIDSGKPDNRASSLVFAPNSREDGPDEAAWNVFDAFCRIRVALFRSLVESLGGAVADEPTPSHRSHVVSSNLAAIVSELKSIRTDKGFVVVAMSPASEAASAVELLQREMPTNVGARNDGSFRDAGYIRHWYTQVIRWMSDISGGGTERVSQDTLLVVAGLCSHDTKPIRFLAQGPAAKTLHKASTIWDLPTFIRGAISSRCQGLGCRIHRHEAVPLPVAQLKVIPHNTFPVREISRNATQIWDNENKTLTAASSSKVEEVKKPQDLKLNAGKEGTGIGADKRTAPEIKARNSTADVKMAETFSMIIGVITALVAFSLTC